MIELYHAERCPYCVKVRYFMEMESIAYVSKPVPLGSGSTALKEELMRLGGKTQVPFLVDPEKGVTMYESDDIIDHLKKHYLKS